MGHNLTVKTQLGEQSIRHWSLFVDEAHRRPSLIRNGCVGCGLAFNSSAAVIRDGPLVYDEDTLPTLFAGNLARPGAVRSQGTLTPARSVHGDLMSTFMIFFGRMH